MPTVRYTTVNGEVIAEKRNGVRSLYVPDPLGSTVALLDNTQAQTDTFKYWPYGETVRLTGSTPTPFQFVGIQGYYTDSTPRTYVRARTLDVVKSRWLTQDPLGFEGNECSYTDNNPITRADPSGKDWCGFAYGKCCGPLRRGSCDASGKPTTVGDDCVDKACCKHDCCLAT